MWNNSKEKLPEKDGLYLVTECLFGIPESRRVVILNWSYIDNYWEEEDNHWGWTCWNSYEDCEDEVESSWIIAWMPLPEPFKGEP